MRGKQEGLRKKGWIRVVERRGGQGGRGRKNEGVSFHNTRLIAEFYLIIILASQIF